METRDPSTSVKNVVVVIVDALRHDRIGKSRGNIELTPNINNLVSDSIVFENAYSCTNATDPSVTSIHTGLFPRSTVYHHWKFVTEKEKRRVESAHYLPEILVEYGYDTVAAGRAMGRWHQRGFNKYPSLPSSDKFESNNLAQCLQQVSPELYSVVSKLYNITEELIAGSDELGELRKYRKIWAENEEEEFSAESFFNDIGKDPFYGFIHLMDTHTPYLPSPDMVSDLLDTGCYSQKEFTINESRTRLARISEEDLDYGIGRIEARYDGAVRSADEKIGDIIDGLKRRDLWEETAFFILADHGESINEHGIFCDHHGLYDETIHIPFILHLPNAAGREISDFVQLTDFMPTVLDLFSIEDKPPTHGESLVPLIKGSKCWEGRNEIIAEEAHTQRRAAIRTKNWKYIEHQPDEVLETQRGSSLKCAYCNEIHGDEEELYNIQKDEGEINNVVNDNTGVASRLSTILDQRISSLSTMQESQDTLHYDNEEAVMQRLSELGYR